jgi:CRP-like cAMP-binding protein
VNGEARERLRQLLGRRAKELGLTPGVVDGLVRSAVLERWSAGDEIGLAADGVERFGMVVVGALNVSCLTPRGKRIGVTFVAPGGLVTGTWPDDGRPWRHELRVTAHDPLGTIVALWPVGTFAEIVAVLPPLVLVQVTSAAWRTASAVARQKCHLLGLGLRDRVLVVLQALARDFGTPHPLGRRIELRLTHADLAGAAVGSRANVTRALEELRTDGLVGTEQHRLLVTHRGLSALREDERDAPWPASAVGG